MPVILQFDRLGGPEALELRDVPAPEPGPGEVRYVVDAFGLNRGELLYMADTYYGSPVFPSRVGHEACGVVDAVGEGVTAFRVGDRVSSIPHDDNRYCVNGEWAITPEPVLASWPENVSAEAGCGVWAQAMCAYYALVELGRVTSRDTVLVTAGSSTSGNGAIQMAKLLGARVIATSRTHAKDDFLHGLGADAVIATDEEDLARRIDEITAGEGARVVFDTITGSFVGRYVDGLAQDALVLLVGALDDDFTVSFPTLPLVRAGASVLGYSMFKYHHDEAMRERGKRFVVDALRRGDLTPVIDSVVPFSEVRRAYARLQSGEQTGKIVVRVRD